MVKNSVWGPVQSSEQDAEGILWVSTDSHGGFILSKKRHKEIQSCLSAPWETFAGGTNYEEDCDAKVVLVMFPKFFPAVDVARAWRCILANPTYYKSVHEWLSKKSTVFEDRYGNLVDAMDKGADLPRKRKPAGL